jgi:hypothetical protein
MLLTILCTYGGSLGLVALTLGVAGSSYQVGKICLLNGHRSTATSWGPIFGVAFLSLLLQLLTFLNCVQVAVRPLVSERLFEHSQRHHHLRVTIAPDLRHELSSKQAASRIRKLLIIQWRPIGMVVLVAVYTAFVTLAFRRVGIADDYPADATEQWLSCLTSFIRAQEDACDPLLARIRVNENELLAALCMIAVS